MIPIRPTPIAAALMLLCGIAQAQEGGASGQITLYGRIDLFAAQETSNEGASDGGKRKVLNSGGQSGSRLGLFGSEALGKGWRARFRLEQGINADVGSLAQGSRAWGREATVGLSGPFGSLDLGRRDSAYYDFRNGFVAIISTAGFDPVGAVFGETNTGNVTVTGGVKTAGTSGSSSITNTALEGASASAPGDFTSRLDNNLHYEAPRLGPLRLSVGYALGEDKRVVAGTQGKAGSVLSMRAQATFDAWDLGMAHQREEFRSSITSAGVLQGQARKSLTAFGVGYKFGVARVAAMLNLDEFVSPSGVSQKAREWALGVSVPAGAWTFNAMAARGQIKGVSRAAQGWGAQALYAFSRRTDVYLAHTQNRDDNSPTTGSVVRTAGVKDSLTGVGVRHRF